MKKTVEMARLRHTCCLGLPSAIVMPQILEELHQIVMSDRMHFYWTDKLGNTVNSYYEKPDTQSLDYFKHNHQRYFNEIGINPRQVLFFGKTTGNLRWPFRPGFENTESHKRLYELLGLQHTMDGVVRDRYGPLGLVLLFRRKGDPDFNTEDEENLAQTLPYIAHAVSYNVKTPASFVEAGDEGLIVFDSAGRLEYQSSRALELCLYALSENTELGFGAGVGMRDYQSALCVLFDRVKSAFSEHLLSSHPPAWVISNRWGQFQLRAYSLQKDSEKLHSYGVIIKKKLPIEVWILEKVKKLPLSNKQREVCYLLASGVETDELANMLSITPTTLKDHIRTVYRKLGISKREELLRLVLA